MRNILLAITRQEKYPNSIHVIPDWDVDISLLVMFLELTKCIPLRMANR
jgi:hypothetical protein